MRRHGHKHLAGLVALGIVLSLIYGLPGNPGQAAGLDDVTPTLSDSEATGAESRVQVVFTPITRLDTADTIRIYLGPNTGGSEWTDGDADQSGADVACTQTGATFDTGTFSAATATVPMYYQMTKASGAGSTATVTCTLGSGAADAPNNPAAADGYSIAVVTTDDTGAGIAYVGNANDVTVSATTLPNLSLTIAGADGIA